MIFREHVPQIKPDSLRIIKHTPQPIPIPPERTGDKRIQRPSIVITPPKILTPDIPDAHRRRWTSPGPKPAPR